MQAGARHAVRRAGGAGAATTVSASGSLHTVGQRVRAQGNRDEFTGVNRRDVLGRVHSLEVGGTAATSPYLPLGVLQVIVHGLPLVLFFATACEAYASGMSLRADAVAGSLGRGAAPGKWHGPADVAGARCRLGGRRSSDAPLHTRPSARVHRWGPVSVCVVFVAAGEAASERARRASQGRAVWPGRSSAARRCRQARAHPRARPQLVCGRAGLALQPLSCSPRADSFFFFPFFVFVFCSRTRTGGFRCALWELGRGLWFPLSVRVG